MCVYCIVESFKWKSGGSSSEWNENKFKTGKLKWLIVAEKVADLVSNGVVPYFSFLFISLLLFIPSNRRRLWLFCCDLFDLYLSLSSSFTQCMLCEYSSINRIIKTEQKKTPNTLVMVFVSFFSSSCFWLYNNKQLQRKLHACMHAYVWTNFR